MHKKQPTRRVQIKSVSWIHLENRLSNESEQRDCTIADWLEQAFVVSGIRPYPGAVIWTNSIRLQSERQRDDESTDDHERGDFARGWMGVAGSGEFANESARGMDVIREQYERHLGGPGGGIVQKEWVGGRARAYPLNLARDPNALGRRTCLYVYGRTHGGPGHTQGCGRCDRCRCRQSTGLFLYGSLRNQNL